MAKFPSQLLNDDTEAELDIERLASGVDPERVDPNHHLWRNGRLWWIAFTIHRGHLQERVRFSLRTAEVEEARRRRDRVLALVAQARDYRISLRFSSRRRSAASDRARVSEAR